MLTVWRPAD